jgi:hypothetical protein
MSLRSSKIMAPALMKKIDHSAMTVNQIFIISLPIIGFILDTPWPLLFTGVVLLAGLLHPNLALFTLFYKYVVKPLGILKPHVEMDHPQPHRFAHLLGGVFLLVACAFLFTGYEVIGWVLGWIVVVLAHLNLQSNFCVGCFMYLYLVKFHVPGFASKAAGS